jgi:hypothetical protein
LFLLAATSDDGVVDVGDVTVIPVISSSIAMKDAFGK